MKHVLLLLFLGSMLSLGCEIDSANKAGSYPQLPVSPTRTLDVPGMYASLQEAVDAAKTGDFIRVAAGIYLENIRIASKNIGLRGAGAGQTIIEGVVEIERSETSFEGFTVRGGGLHVTRSPVRISGNEMTGNPGAGIQLEYCLNVVISDNALHHNGKEGLVFTDSTGVIGSTSVTANGTDGIVINNSSPTLTGNRILSNARDGVSIRGFTYQSAPLLLENTIRANGGASNYDIICFGGNTNPTGAGNVFDRCMTCAECKSLNDPATYYE